MFVDSWVDEQLDRCFQLMETDDPSLFGEWTARWSDLAEFEVVPVLSSSEASERVRARGWLADDGTLSEAGAAVRQRIEDRTDEAALAPWAALGDDGCARLLEAARPLARAVVKSGVFGPRPG